MKKIILTLALWSIGALLFAQTFDHYFDTTRLRVNLVFAGNAEQQSVYLESLNKEPRWGGSQTALIDSFDYGEYSVKIFAADNRLIYSHGFTSLFHEWRTTDEAKNNSRAHTGSILIPMPKQTVRLNIYERVKTTGQWQRLYTTSINPADNQIQHEAHNRFNITPLLHNGAPEKKVDVAFIAEGYTADEMDKFRADAARFTGYLFDSEPFASRKNDFNVWAVEAISPESGTDVPHAGIWKHTIANASFNTFGIDRYLTAPSQQTLCEIAWATPYDVIYVIVNTSMYGGGGIYNFYGLSMADHRLAKEVFIHEFGHAFAGLGDEYYQSAVTYENFYNVNIEPWEPNLTTLVTFHKKWAAMLKPGTPVPTPNRPEYANTTGVFEGGGYVSKGVYRPALDCRMKSNEANAFCPVCQHSISKMIDHYSKTTF